MKEFDCINRFFFNKFGLQASLCIMAKTAIHIIYRYFLKIFFYMNEILAFAKLQVLIFAL